MNRRDFLRKFRAPLAAAVAVPVAAAAATGAAGQRLADPAVKALRGQYSDLKRRVDGMEESQKKMLRAVLAVAGMSIGMDLSMMV
jgi:hypothetical protein